ncbi:MAG: hypothetical protein ACTSU4_00610 [Promethearchaeota archaeon]
MSRPILQLFKVNPDGTTTEIKTQGPIKDVLKSDESYVLVSDELRKVFLWKGARSSVRSKFIGAKRSQDIRGQVGMHFSVVPLDEGEEDPEFLAIIGGKTAGATAQEIKHEQAAGSVPSTPSNQEAPRQSRTIPSSPPTPTVRNEGPLYRGKESMSTLVQEEIQVNVEHVLKKLEEIENPQGYERELIIIGNHAYAVVEKVQTFLGEKKVEKVIERVGSIPEGIFFAENYTPRLLTEGGKIIAIEFLKRVGAGPSGRSQASKRDVLKSQISKQLLGK